LGKATPPWSSLHILFWLETRHTSCASLPTLPRMGGGLEHTPRQLWQLFRYESEHLTPDPQGSGDASVSEGFEVLLCEGKFLRYQTKFFHDIVSSSHSAQENIF